MTKRRLLGTLAISAAAALSIFCWGCGFGLADDSGKPLPGQYWGWACADGGAPDGPGGCLGADASGSDAGDAGSMPTDGAAPQSAQSAQSDR